MKRPLVFAPFDYASSRIHYLLGEEARVLRRRLLVVLAAGAITWPLAGLGFYYLEPSVANWFEGSWLAFVTGATVGYGDVVPTTLASKLFAVPLVLIGLAYLSLVTATISALFVGETERKVDQVVLAELRMLRKEVHGLREELDALRGPHEPQSEAARGPAAAPRSGQPGQPEPPA